MLRLSAIPELWFGMMGDRDVPRCSIVPPYVLEALAQAEDARLAGAAHQTILLTAELAERRLLLLERGERHLADERRVVYDAAHGRELPGALLRREGGPACADPRANAFWDGTEMVYGDGDGVVLGDFTRALDVIAHELTHGLTRVLR